MKNILFIVPGPNPPAKRPELGRFHHMKDLRGAILSPVPWRSAEDSEKYFGFPSFPTHTVGNFTYYFMPGYVLSSPVNFLRRFAFYIREGLRLHRKDPFDIIIPYGTNVTGLAALVLSILTRVPMVPEIGGIPRDAIRFDEPSGHVGLVTKIKKVVSDCFLLLCGMKASGFRLMFPGQLHPYPFIQNKPVFCFHEFVPVSSIAPGDRDDNYILFLGFPWYLKGVDLLINAWKKLESKYPNVRLKLVGYFPDPAPLEKLRGSCSSIDICKPVYQPEAIELIQHCSLLVLPSRTESMGRVLLEAMAARKPVVASDAGGIPFFVSNEQTGLLFRSGDEDDLAQKIDVIMSQLELRNRIANKAHSVCLESFNEKVYGEKFLAMVESICDGH